MIIRKTFIPALLCVAAICANAQAEAHGYGRPHHNSPVVRDHRSKPVVRDHRTPVVVRDHRNSSETPDLGNAPGGVAVHSNGPRHQSIPCLGNLC
jgi:hypothetical protein